MIAVFAATGMRLSELAGIRYDPGDPRRSDLNLGHREITVRGKACRKTRTVKISHDAARALDRYIRVRAPHAQAISQGPDERAVQAPTAAAVNRGRQLNRPHGKAAQDHGRDHRVTTDTQPRPRSGRAERPGRRVLP